MSGNVNNQNDFDVGAWNKMCKTVSEAGFREGAAAGRNSTFQKGFDSGYQEGYKNSLALGYLKGAISILEEQTTNLATKSWNSVLEKTSRGLCQLCEKSEHPTTSVSELSDKQRQHVLEAVEKIQRDNSVLLEGLISDNEIIQKMNFNPLDTA